MSVTSTASSVRPHRQDHPQDQDELAVHDRRVTVEGMHTQYLEAGAGPVLLLLHGHEQSATSWRWVIPALARTHRVLALSLPGHGETAAAVGDYAPTATRPASWPRSSTPSTSTRHWTWSDTPQAGRSRSGWRWPTPSASDR